MNDIVINKIQNIQRCVRRASIAVCYHRPGHTLVPGGRYPARLGRERTQGAGVGVARQVQHVTERYAVTTRGPFARPATRDVLRGDEQRGANNRRHPCGSRRAGDTTAGVVTADSVSRTMTIVEVRV